MGHKNNSRNVPQHYPNNVFKYLFQSGRLMLSVRSAAGSEFQRRAPAAEKLVTKPSARSLHSTRQRVGWEQRSISHELMVVMQILWKSAV